MPKVMMPKFILYITVLIGALFMSTSCSSNNVFTHYNKPYFSIEFTAKRLGVDIRLNDIPVFNIDNMGFMTLEVPVNPYIINGDNEIKVITFPLFDDEDEQYDNYIEGASIDIALYVRDDNEPIEKRKLISNVSIVPGNAYLEDSEATVATFVNGIDESNRSVLKTEKNATILDYPSYGNFKKQVVTKWVIKGLKSSLPFWQWQDGELIKNNDETYKTLLEAYADLHKAFLSKDLELVKKISQPRSKELAIAYYLSDENAGFDYSALGKDIDHPTIKLYKELAVNVSKLEVFGNGKLARIMDGGDIHPILFIDNETEQFYLPQFKWYLNKNKEWILIR